MGQDYRPAWRCLTTVGCLWLALLLVVVPAEAVRFTMGKKECFTYNVEYDGDTVHASFVVVEVQSSWKFEQTGVDLIVSAGPAAQQLLSRS